MITAILAGGKGSRLGGDTPKPLIPIGPRPIIDHIMDIYKKWGHDKFIILTGYKHEMFEEHFKDNPNVYCLYTGEESGTGDRIQQCFDLIRQPFMLTYGDAVGDIQITDLLALHYRYRAPITLTAVHAQPRFGQILFDDDYVNQFNEKARSPMDWINGGFMVLDRVNISGSFEFDWLPALAADRRVTAYRHTGYWRCMDAPRDVVVLRRDYEEGAPWL